MLPDEKTNPYGRAPEELLRRASQPDWESEDSAARPRQAKARGPGNQADTNAEGDGETLLYAGSDAALLEAAQAAVASANAWEDAEDGEERTAVFRPPAELLARSRKMAPPPKPKPGTSPAVAAHAHLSRWNEPGAAVTDSPLSEMLRSGDVRAHQAITERPPVFDAADVAIPPTPASPRISEDDEKTVFRPYLPLESNPPEAAAPSPDGDMALQAESEGAQFMRSEATATWHSFGRWLLLAFILTVASVLALHLSALGAYHR